MSNSKPLYAGYEVRTPDPGEHESMTCSTCGDAMDVERDVEGATGFAEAMAGRKHKYDRFTCPNAGTDWHVQVIKLMQEADRTASASVEKVIREEIVTVLGTRVATKKVSHF